MTGESSSRSNLIDVTYAQLHSWLMVDADGTSIDQLKDNLLTRKSQLSNISAPFGTPSDASRKQIESGHVTLADSVKIPVDEADRDFVFAISSKLQIDQVQALIFLRSFLYNRGLPAKTGAETDEALIAELLEAITPFYYAERVSLCRTLTPLLRAKDDPVSPISELANDVLPSLLPDPRHFIDTILTEYLAKTQQKLPQDLHADPRVAARWAKQVMREQLALLEVLFWAAWAYSPLSAKQVERIYEAMYNTNLGSAQRYSTLLLDEEGIQLQRDCAAVWILISIEVLELENLTVSSSIEIAEGPDSSDALTSSPDSLLKVHDMVLSHQGSQYACTYLAWTFVLSRMFARAAELKEVPPSFRKFFESLSTPSRAKDREPAHVLMARLCLQPDVGLFNLILDLLTNSPVFVTAVAWRTGSSVSDPNAIAYRSVLKGFLMALVELVPVEMIPDFDGLVNVWITLFGRSESQRIAAICTQFWQSDWPYGIARRAIFDVSRSRFPIHVRPLVQLLRSMTAAGFLDTDPLSTSDFSPEVKVVTEDRRLCTSLVLGYLNKLTTYSVIVPITSCTGPHALYERQSDRHGQAAAGYHLVNLRPIRLPGGSTLPAKSKGRLLSGDGGDVLVICWQHEHSGWKLLLEILTDYVHKRNTKSASDGAYKDVNFGRQADQNVKTLRLDEIGIELGSGADDGTITDILDLIRSLIHDNPLAAEELMRSLEVEGPLVTQIMAESSAPDLVQLTTMILEEALSTTDARVRPHPRSTLITSALSVLSSLLVLPGYSNRVWLYIRSTTALFGSDRVAGYASVALDTERATGHYTMTLSLLYLVQQLFKEASSSVLPDDKRLQQLKEDVLMRAIRFVHTEVWVEHLGWKYAQLGDRFEIGRRISSLYLVILEQSPPTLPDRPFPALSQAVADALLYKATTSSIHPLVTSLSSAGSILRKLESIRRLDDMNGLIYMLESHLKLTRLVLVYKQRWTISQKPSVLEQALCARTTQISGAEDVDRANVDPIDALALYVKARNIGVVVPVEAIRVLTSLCACLATSSASGLTVVGHLSNAEETVVSFVRIIEHPYEDLALRYVVWTFITLAVEVEPALATLFVTGHFRGPQHLLEPKVGSEGEGKGKGKEVTTSEQEKEKEKAMNGQRASAFDKARDILANWKDIWESNPQLLASVLRFLDAVWQHGLEHRATLRPIIDDEDFWKQVVGILAQELGPTPEYDPDAYASMDGVRQSNFQEPVVMHCYRIMSKSHAAHILGLDIDLHRQAEKESTQKPKSFLQLEPRIRSSEDLTELLSEVSPSSYDPEAYDRLAELFKSRFPGLTLDQLRTQEATRDRQYGEDFEFSSSLLRSRLQAYRDSEEMQDDSMDLAEKSFLAINLNLSLTNAQTTLSENWQHLLRKIAPFTRGDASTRHTVLSIAEATSHAIASEKRLGDMMSTVHGTRLSLLLAMLEVVWFSPSEKDTEARSFVQLIQNVHGIIINDSQPPMESFLGTLSVPFHRTLLQIVYFCLRTMVTLSRQPKLLTAEYRLSVTSMAEAAFSLVADALRIVFLSARSRVDVELDRDMELLVAVFHQCTQKEINPSSSTWLARCQETDIIRCSLDLFVHTDLVGLTDLPLLLSRKQPLYAPHLLLFHMALVRHPAGAERFASEGVLTAYSNNFISAAVSSGQIDVALPELPGERSPAHRAYCSMLAIVAGVISALGKQNHYFDGEASGFVQFCGDQIARSLSWTIGDPITFALIEEMEQVVRLFYAIAESRPTIPVGGSGRVNEHSQKNPGVGKVLSGFSGYALNLLQQLNYAITHPNHLASLFEPVTADERAQLEKESLSIPSSSTGTGDVLQRPLMAYLIHRLFKLSSNLVETLVTISRADTVLVGEQADWPLHEALVTPHSKVVLREQASIGTLLELGNCTLDILRDLVGRPSGQSLLATSPTATPFLLKTSIADSSLDVRQGILTARRNLETILVYAVTQLAMWLSSPEFDKFAGGGGGGGVDVEDMEMKVEEKDQYQRPHQPRQRRHSGSLSTSTLASSTAGGPSPSSGSATTSTSTTLAERMRRGMTGEMTADLQSLLNKAKPVLLRCEPFVTTGKASITVGTPATNMDLTEVLSKFLHDRISPT